MAELSIKDRLLIELGISTDETDKVALVDNALWQAGEYIKEKRRTSEVEKRFEYIQFQIAVRLWNIRGIEGENSHYENGVKRSFYSDGVIADLMRKVPAPVIVG